MDVYIYAQLNKTTALSILNHMFAKEITEKRSSFKHLLCLYGLGSVRIYYMTLSCFSLCFLVAFNEMLQWERSCPGFHRLCSFPS